jgi:trehalose 2-sulfotransferase
MYTHHKLDHEFGGDAQTRTTYAVCALPRSGSSLLCELLFSTGRAGAPAEYFDAQLMKQFCRRWDVTGFDEYLRELLARKTGPNGAFGFKAHFFQLAEAFPGSRIDTAFPGLRHVYITRRDRLRQAISWSRALQSNKWASDHEVEQEHPVAFRRAQIDNLIAGIAERERRWEDFFARSSARPLRLAYEDLVVSPQDTVVATLRHIGVDHEQLSIGTPALRRQADEVTEEWVSRYLDRDGLVASRW